MPAVSVAPKGSTTTRLIRSMLIAKGDMMAAAQTAEADYGAGSGPARILRAAVESGSLTPSETWGSELGEAQLASREFFGLVAEQSLVGRMAGLRRVPLNVKLAGIAGGASAAWVGAGNPKPLSELVLGRQPLPPRKISASLVIAHELARAGGPEAEALLRTELVRCCSEFLDAALTDPLATEVTDVSPASITSGASSTTSSGNPATDLAWLIANFDGDLSSSYLLMHPTTAAELALARDSGGAFTFVDLGPRGGSAIGVPVLTSRAVPMTTDGGLVILVDASGIALGGGQVVLDSARHASIEMETAPTETASAEVIQTSLWQRNLTSVRAEIWTNWITLRPGSVALVTAATYNTEVA